MSDYWALPGFENLYLEDSWVLGIDESADEFGFNIDAVLIEDHPEWHPPKPDEMYADKRLRTVFRKPREVTWLARSTRPPVADLSGEVDYGNIDVFTWDGSVFELEFGLGHVRVEGDPPVIVDSV